MTKYITATEANQNLSRVLRDVAAGTTYTVTSRGKPVAEITQPRARVSNSDKRKSLEEMFKRMDELPGIITGPYTRDDLYDRNW